MKNTPPARLPHHEISEMADDAELLTDLVASIQQQLAPDLLEEIATWESQTNTALQHLQEGEGRVKDNVTEFDHAYGQAMKLIKPYLPCME